MQIKIPIYPLKQTQIKTIIAVIGVLIVGFLSFITIVLSYDLSCDRPMRYFTIQKGATVANVADMLVEDGCLPNRNIFKIAIKLTFNDRDIKAGRYTLKGIRTVNQLIKMITSPTATRHVVSIIEGWTLEQIVDALEDKLDIDRNRFLDLCRDHNFINSLDINAPSLEGFLFPDTYIFLSTYAEEDIIQIMVNQFFYIYENYVEPEISKNRLTRLEITTLASIIQGESIYRDEMATVSSVFHNRLDRKMKLQADPTIQYILPKRKRKLYSKHLQIDSPYNTYMYPGLPPGPINSPGKAALLAAAAPKDTEYIYFVADGKGRHIFTRTNREHINAKNRVKRRK